MIDYQGLKIEFVDFGGGVTSDSLFAPKEAEIFRFYRENSGRYRRALDIGANIGVHTCLMRRSGWSVKAFEPDKTHYMELCINYLNNLHLMPRGVVSSELHLGAVSDHDGTATFVRVKGNTTGSHLKGDKRPYGELEEFEVPVVDCRPLFNWADFVKMDCEGHEARLLMTVTAHQAVATDFMVEVGNEANAEAIYNHFQSLPTKLWAQKNNWQNAQCMADMPTHHSHGALFIGNREPFPP